jgi:hypothetical protein
MENVRIMMHGKCDFLHDDSSAPHHHQLMPSDKAVGQYNTKPLQVLNCNNCNTTVDILVAGFCWIRTEGGTVALVCGVNFWTNFSQWGG